MELLDNPIWNALATEHAGLALGDGRARRYPNWIGPLAGMPEATDECYARLAPLAETPVVLFCVDPIAPPEGWSVLRRGPLVQMLRPAGATLLETAYGVPGAEGANLRQLTAEDAPAMVALAELTEPGPFRLRTIELGNFYGVFHGVELVAMAGKRLHLPGVVELSGVCTHPEARGRGYARRLMSIVIAEIEREGKQAFLHALAQNPAIQLYEQLGFVLRRQFDYSVLARSA